jgi:2-polyprenyl-6-methoxyphenol hydroxylase-like FAD-dependent oxidoreductase
MARIAIVGAGMAGLGAALFMARRGHAVDVVEQDPDEAPDDPEAAFSDWKRRGVPQARHSHNFLGLSSKILSEEAPDLLAALKASGAFHHVRWGRLEDPFAYSLFARRLVYEAEVRRFARRESGVTLHRGVRASGLIAHAGGRAPQVVGVKLEEQGELSADLVVDASGRWTKARDWLEAIGARPWRETLQETPIFYLTRWYRLKDGQSLPAGRYPLAVPLPYLLAIAFPADNGVFAVSLAPSMADPFRARLRDPLVFTRFLQALPQIAQLIDRGEPITEPLQLARINNCHRSLVDDAGPCVGGFVLLGDSADHTNPTLGRGISLGLAQAQFLAETADAAVKDPLGHAARFERWTNETTGAWFRQQVASDAAYLHALDASLAGKTPPPASPELRFRRALFALAEEDPDAAVAAARDYHVLAPPGAARAVPLVAARVRAYLESSPAPPAPQGPTRRGFEALVG